MSISKNALIICNDYPLPELTGSRMRTMNFVRYLLLNYQVDIIYNSGADEKSVENIFRKKYQIKKKIDYNLFTNFYYKIDKIINFRPWIVDSFSFEYKNKINDFIMNNNYELIIVRYIHNLYPLLFLNNLKNLKIVLDCDDIFSDSLYGVLYPLKNDFIYYLRRKLDYFLLKKYQKKCFEKSVPIFCSEEDQQAMIQNTSRPSFVVSNTYPMNMEHFDIKSSGHNNFLNLLFVGSLSYSPNIDGLKFFISNFIPYLKDKYINFVFNVVGRSPSNSFIDYCGKFDCINLFPNAENLKKHYENCFAVVVPLLSGGGTRIKILESALLKRPVISTDIGAYGLKFSLKNNILLYKDLDTFENSIFFLKDRCRYESFVLKAYDIVRTNYSQSSFNDSLDSILKYMHIC